MSKFFKLSEISLVTGPSGAGKTTYANTLSKQTGIPVYHIDDDKIWQKWYNSNRTKPLKETKESYRKVSEKLNRKYLNIKTPAIIEGQQLLESASFPKHINKVYVVDPGMDEVIRRRVSRNPTRNTADFAKELYTASKPKMDFLLSVNDPRFEKISEYAPGIPDKNMMASLPNVTSGQRWEFVVQEHRANRAGLHMDFRIGPPGGVGFSWVLKNGLPANGEKVLAIRQPDHCLLPNTKVMGMTIKEAFDKKIPFIRSLINNEIKEMDILEWSESEKEIRDVIKIQFKGLRNSITNLFCTPGHRIYTKNGIKFAADLTTEDQLLKTELQFNEDQLQVLYGSLLGDGCISNDGRFKEAHPSQEAYIKFKYDIFKSAGAKLKQHKTSKNNFSKKDKTWWLTIPVNSELRQLRDKLYTPQKHITLDFLNKLNPLALAIWYMDDGNIQYNQKRLAGCQLSTQGFSEENNKLLQTWLKNKYDLDTYLIYSKRYKNPFLRFNRTNAIKFFNLIKYYIIPEMEYKILFKEDVVLHSCNKCGEQIYSNNYTCNKCILQNINELDFPSQISYSKNLKKLSSVKTIQNNFSSWNNAKILAQEYELYNNPEIIKNAYHLENIGTKVKDIDKNANHRYYFTNILNISKHRKNTRVYNFTIPISHNYEANGIIVGNSIKYFEFEGKIKSGYGAGEVKIIDSGQVEVLKANNDKITFYLPRGSQVEKYTLIKTNGNDWLMVNHTIPKSIKELVNPGKLKYKDMSKNYTKELGDFSVPKIDGAYSTTLLRSGKTPLVFGYRESKRTGDLIEYTPKIQRVLESRGPKELGTTLLRTEVFAVTPQGEELPNRLLGGILNSNIFKSRDLQEQQSAPLQLAAFDILKYRGKDVHNKSPEEKLELIRKVSESYPLIQHPIDLSRRYNFREGSVVWRNNVPIKVKNKPDYDVFVKNVFRANTRAGTPRAGGFTYSLTPGGPEIGRIGSGFLHSELQDMLNNPDKYKGRVAKVYAMSQHPSGSLRAPSFNTWHLDKGEINE